MRFGSLCLASLVGAAGPAISSTSASSTRSIGPRAGPSAPSGKRPSVVTTSATRSSKPLRRSAGPAYAKTRSARVLPINRVEDDGVGRAAKTAEGLLMQPRTPVLARLRVAHHRVLAVVDLALLARSGLDPWMGLGAPLIAQLAHEPLHARVAAWEAVVVDHVLPDRHHRAALRHGLLDPLAVGLAGARLRTAPGRRRPGRGVGRRLLGRFCRTGLPPPTRGAHVAARRLQVRTRRLAADPGLHLDAPKRPPRGGQGTEPARVSRCPRRLPSGRETTASAPRQRPGHSLR